MSLSIPAHPTDNDSQQTDYVPQIEKWRDLCVDQVKECFVQLFPLTDVIGKYLCSVVAHLKQLFRLVIVAFKATQLFHCLESRNNFAINRVEWANELNKVIDASSEIAKALTEDRGYLQTCFNNAHRQLSDDDDIWLYTIIDNVHDSVLELKNSLAKWVRAVCKEVGRYTKSLVKEVNSCRDSEKSLALTKSNYDLWLDKIMKSLSVSVGTFLVKVRKEQEMKIPALCVRVLVLFLYIGGGLINAINR